MAAEHLSPSQMPPLYGAAELGGYQAVSPPVTADEMLAWALWYAAQGRHVFPVEVGGKRPAPMALHGFKSGSAEADRIRTWWYKPFNIGCPTGYHGDDVLDVDVRPEGSGWPAFNRLKAGGMLSGAHRLVRTPSSGLHVSFAGTSQRCGSIKGQFIDFKAAGGYLLLPPSQVGGRRYVVIDDRPPTGAVFDWEAAKRLLVPPRPVRTWTGRRSGSVRHLPGLVAREGTGNRNKLLYWAACRAAEAGNEPVLLDLVDAAEAAGLDRAEALRTVASAARKVNGDA